MGDEQAGDKKMAKQRGRRPHAGVAMTGAERQAAYRNRRRKSHVRLEMDLGSFAELIEIVREVAVRPSTEAFKSAEAYRAHTAKSLLPQLESHIAEVFAIWDRETEAAVAATEYADYRPARPD